MFESKQSIKNIKYGYNDTMKIYGKLFGNKYTFKNIPNSNIFKDEKETVKIMEYLGRVFKLDDSRIYSINEYNKKIKNVLDRIELKEIRNVKNIKNILKPQERIKFIYNKLLNNESKGINIIKNIVFREYLAAYYLYNEKTNTH